MYLGQIQTILTFGFTVAFYCWISGREKTSGAILGVMALVKPQYALFLLWAALPEVGALASGIAAFVTGVLASCCVFGFHNNVDYLKVLHFIAMHGESYATNQSMNGLLNRLLFNGSNLIWNESAFAPFNPIVYAGTVLSSLALVGFVPLLPLGSEPQIRRERLCVLPARCHNGIPRSLGAPLRYPHPYLCLAMVS